MGFPEFQLWKADLIFNNECACLLSYTLPDSEHRSLTDILIISGLEFFPCFQNPLYNSVRRGRDFTMEFKFLKRKFHHQSWMALRSESIVMSQTVIVNFEMINRIEFTFIIRVHHVWKTTWFSVINEKLDCKDDDPG